MIHSSLVLFRITLRDHVQQGESSAYVFSNALTAVAKSSRILVLGLKPSMKGMDQYNITLMMMRSSDQHQFEFVPILVHSLPLSA